jgi:ParB-like chromosome segregation protein Spo0J
MRRIQAPAPAPAERPCLVIEYRQTATLRAYGRNARTHSDDQVRQIRASIDRFGFTNPILLKDDGATIGAGHGRWAASQLSPALATVPTVTLYGLSESEWRAYVIADNKIAENSGWDEEMLRAEVADLLDLDQDLVGGLMGFDERDLRVLMNDLDTPSHSGVLQERFLAVPFTVISAREGWWRARKAAWLALGLRSDEGRGKVLKRLGNARSTQLRGAKAEDWVETSIFDPVLCELAYRWFSPPGGVVLDPFAGGSVRGIVAARLGRAYHGIDLRPEQVAANQRQAAEILRGAKPLPVWRCGDSLVELDDPATPEADFVFSCPPYADLEVYSDDPRDLSTMDYEAFLETYRAIIAKACAKLRPDRFACFVVADVRDPAGRYRNFVGETIDAFLSAGLHLYNEAVLVTAVGSLPVRAGKQFAATRKLGKTHQNCLVFVKGEPRKATDACGAVEVGDVEAEADPDDESEPAALVA